MARNGGNNGSSGGNNRNNGGSKWCDNCKMTNHNTVDCTRKFENNANNRNINNNGKNAGNNRNNGFQNGNQIQGKQTSNSHSNNVCSHCGKKGHTDDICYTNPQSSKFKGPKGPQQNKSNQNGNYKNNNDGRLCTYCQRTGHTWKTCADNPRGNNFQGQSNQDQEMPDAFPWSGKAPFNTSCIHCGGNDHYQHQCPNLNQQSSGQYPNMTYPQHPSYLQHQAFGSQPQMTYPFPQPTIPREEFPSPPQTHQAIFSSLPGFRGPTRFNTSAYQSCETQVYMDRDDDVIMSIGEHCGGCYAQTPTATERIIDMNFWGSHLLQGGARQHQ